MSLEARALAVLEDALACATAGERARLVAESCGDDAPLKARVEALLALDHAGPGPFATESFTAPFADADPIPERIDVYRVTGLIGTGGMSRVV